jgi:hypothetical protein
MAQSLFKSVETIDEFWNGSKCHADTYLDGLPDRISGPSLDSSFEILDLVNRIETINGQLRSINPQTIWVTANPVSTFIETMQHLRWRRIVKAEIDMV